MNNFCEMFFDDFFFSNNEMFWQKRLQKTCVPNTLSSDCFFLEGLRPSKKSQWSRRPGLGPGPGWPWRGPAWLGRPMTPVGGDRSAPSASTPYTGRPEPAWIGRSERWGTARMDAKRGRMTESGRSKEAAGLLLILAFFSSPLSDYCPF